jgi:hypothetical protein
MIRVFRHQCINSLHRARFCRETSDGHLPSSHLAISKKNHFHFLSNSATISHFSYSNTNSGGEALIANLFGLMDMFADVM